MSTIKNPVIVGVVITVFMGFGHCREYFVSVSDGSDSNPGTQDKPWKHIQKAVSALQPGDICTIRGGRYYEEVSISGLKGTQDKPITFRSYPGESVVFDGTKGPIKSTWTKYKDNIYQATIEEDIWQLFVDGEMQINARWPNAFWHNYSVFDYTKWGFSSQNSTYDMEKGRGVMNDNGTQGLADSGINATGAIAILNIGSWKTFTGLVESHHPREPFFSYQLESPVGNIKFVPNNCRYFLEDKLEFLDAPTEWYYDIKAKKLYLWTESSDSPENHEITGKKSIYALTITDGSSWIVLSALNFFATTVFIMGSSGENIVQDIQLDSCHFSYPSYSKRMLGSLAVPNTTTIYYSGELSKDSGMFKIFNCTWEYADGQTIKYRGVNGVFVNNLWHHNDFTCVGDGALFQSLGVHDEFVRNVIHSNGPSVGYAPGGARDTLGLPFGDTVRLNLLYDLKFLQNDGSHIQTMINSQNGTILEYNWCFDTMKYGIRFDRVNQDNASWGYNGTISHNVVWSTGGIMVKGDKHRVLNNLVFNSSGLYDMLMFGPPGSGAKQENKHTVVANNILQHGACSNGRVQPCPGNPGNFSNNVNNSVAEYLRDPENLDFRPKPTSDYITKGIGPYGEESMREGGVYWIPGRQLLTASTPIPPNSTMTAKCDAHLMWLEGYNSDSHDVYFGTNKTAVIKATTMSPEFKGNFKSPSNIVDPGPLKSRVMYYWRVDATQGHSKHRNEDVWQFSCWSH